MIAVLKFLARYNRLTLILLVLLAGYQVVLGGNSSDNMAAWAYTIGFGVLVIAGIILILLGNEVLERAIVVVISAVIPLTISLGLVIDYWPAWRWFYLWFIVIGYLIMVFSRAASFHRVSILSLGLFHAVAGLLIVLTPIAVIQRSSAVSLAILWISVGGVLMGMGGLLLAFLRSGRALLSQNQIFTIFPALLLFTLAAFSLGFGAL